MAVWHLVDSTSCEVGAIMWNCAGIRRYCDTISHWVSFSTWLVGVVDLPLRYSDSYQPAGVICSSGAIMIFTECNICFDSTYFACVNLLEASLSLYKKHMPNGAASPIFIFAMIIATVWPNARKKKIVISTFNMGTALVTGNGLSNLYTISRKR